MRWWGSWGWGLSSALLVLAMVWLLLDVTDPFGAADAGLWWKAAIPRSWDELVGWRLVVLALALVPMAAVLSWSLSAGWQGLLGTGAPLAEWLVSGAVAAAAPVLRQLFVSAGWWSEKRDLQLCPGWVVTGALALLALWWLMVWAGSRRREAWDACRAPSDPTDVGKRMASDAPARSIADDRLGRTEAAAGLARLILDEEPPFVVGIDGEWGSGKSSLMNMVSDELHEMRDRPGVGCDQGPDGAQNCDEREPAAWAANAAVRVREQFASDDANPQTSWAAGRVVVARVNLWEHQHAEDPAVALLQAARDTLPPGSRHEVTDEIKAIMVAGAFDGTAVKGLALGGGAVGEVNLGAMRQSLLRGRADRFVVQERQARLSGRFSTVLDEVRRVHIADRVIFVLDDLDRCLPAVALDLLEKVHLLFRKPGCVVVIGIDTRVLELTVAKRYEEQGAEKGYDTARSAGRLAQEYVEKIFDFTYRIPPVDDASLATFVGQMLGPLRSTTRSGVRERELATIRKLFVEGLTSSDASLRRAKRLVNSFIVYHSIKCENLPVLLSDATADRSPGAQEPKVPGEPASPQEKADGPTASALPAGPGGEVLNEPLLDDQTIPTPEDPVISPAPELYHPFLLAAVTAILVLHPEEHRKLSGPHSEGSIAQWFGLAGNSPTDSGPDGAIVAIAHDTGSDSKTEFTDPVHDLRNAIVDGMDSIVDLRRRRRADPQGLIKIIGDYVKMMVAPPWESVDGADAEQVAPVSAPGNAMAAGQALANKAGKSYEILAADSAEGIIDPLRRDDPRRTLLITYVDEAGATRSASGTHLHGDVVLSAGHCGRGTGHKIWYASTRGESSRDRAALSAQVAWVADTVNVAILTVDGLPDVQPLGLAVMEEGTAAPLKGCILRGFPNFAQPRGSESPQRTGLWEVRDATLLPSQQLVFDTDATIHPRNPSADAWAGLAGGAVCTTGSKWCVGIVDSIDLSLGPNTLEVVTFDALRDIELRDDVEAFWSLVGSPEMLQVTEDGTPGPVRTHPEAMAGVHEASLRRTNATSSGRGSAWVLRVLGQHAELVTSVAFGEDGESSLLASGSAKGVGVWDSRTEKSVASIHISTQVVAFGQVDKNMILATGDDEGIVRLWDPFSGQPALRSHRLPHGVVLESHVAPVRSVAFGQVDGRPVVATGSDDYTARLWDPTTGQLLRKPLAGHRNSVRSVAFGQVDGYTVLATGSGDATVRLWDVATGQPVGLPLEKHEGAVYSVAFGQDNGRVVLATGSADATVRLWDVVTGRPVATGHRVAAPFNRFARPVRAVAFGRIHEVSALAACSDDATVRLWYTDSEMEPDGVRCPEAVAGLAFLPDGRLALAIGSSVVLAHRSDG